MVDQLLNDEHILCQTELMWLMQATESHPCGAVHSCPTDVDIDRGAAVACGAVLADCSALAAGPGCSCICADVHAGSHPVPHVCLCDLGWAAASHLGYTLLANPSGTHFADVPTHHHGYFAECFAWPAS